MKAFRRALILSSAAAVLPLTTVLASPAAAAHVTCGMTISQNTTLHANVGPCPAGGVVIGTNGITLDLKGFTVFGTGATDDGAGILLDGVSGVTVKNGTVTAFDGGVVIDGGSNNVIERVRVVGNVGSGRTDFGDGIVGFATTGNQIRFNTVVDNGPFSGIALVGSTSANNTIHANVVRSNDELDVAEVNHGDPTGTMNDIGIRLEPRTHNNTVSSNTVEANGLDGIQIFARSTDNVVRDNTSRGNGYHNKNHRKGSGMEIFSFADRNLVQNNRFIGNAANGIAVRITSLDNQLLGNVAYGNEQIPGRVIAYDAQDQNRFCASDDGTRVNQWHGNTAPNFNQPCVVAP